MEPLNGQRTGRICSRVSVDYVKSFDSLHDEFHSGRPPNFPVGLDMLIFCSLSQLIFDRYEEHMQTKIEYHAKGLQPTTLNALMALRASFTEKIELNFPWVTYAQSLAKT